MNLVKDVSQYLANTALFSPYNRTGFTRRELKGMGLVGQNIYLSRFPEAADTPDSLIVLFEYAGQPVNALDSAYRCLSLQVQVRDTAYESGLQRAQTIDSLLTVVGNTDWGVPPLSIDGTRYDRFVALQSPYKLKEDSQRRLYFAQNYRVWARKL